LIESEADADRKEEATETFIKELDEEFDDIQD
jgi:hypothetical protein